MKKLTNRLLPTLENSLALHIPVNSLQGSLLKLSFEIQFLPNIQKYMQVDGNLVVGGNPVVYSKTYNVLKVFLINPLLLYYSSKGAMTSYGIPEGKVNIPSYSFTGSYYLFSIAPFIMTQYPN